MGAKTGLTVDIGAVEAARVDHPEFAIVPSKLGVTAAGGDVVEEDVTVGMPASADHGLIQQKPRSRVGAPLHHKQGRIARKGSPHPRLCGGGGSVELAEKVGAESGGGVPGAFVSHLGVVLVAHFLVPPAVLGAIPTAVR
jgi:hypothetical protein